MEVELVQQLAADHGEPLTFFCGGSRNYPMFVDLFDAVFVLEIDTETLRRRLDERPPDEFGASGHERALVERLHREHTGIPDGVAIDATRPLSEVVDAIMRLL